MMHVIYIAGPYTADNSWEIESNIRRAEELGYIVTQEGFSVIIPHSNTRFFHGTNTPEFWYEATLELLRRCDAVVFVPGYEKSKGSLSEEYEACKLGLPIYRPVIDAPPLRDWLRTLKAKLDGTI